MDHNGPPHNFGSISMPKPVAKKATPVTAPTKPKVVPTPSNPHGLAVKYDRVTATVRDLTSPDGPIYAAEWKEILGWETEKEFQKRMAAERPGTKPEEYKYGDDFHCFNTRGEKVRCHNNVNNRPFDIGWCQDLVHTLLQGQWAGPFAIPGETINGETARISRYGRVLSAQHTGSACILADEFLQASRGEKNYDANHPKFPAWNGQENVFVETILVTGLSEDERVTRTIDYVKPRTAADMLFTMELFRNNTANERKEMTRMLAQAIDTLWSRTDTKGYRTHPEIVAFLERHKTLLKCVEHLFQLNSVKAADDGGRKISKLRLSAGMCSTICYLMGCSGPDTDGDVYRNENPPSERNLDWSYYDRACEFWRRLAGHDDFVIVRRALNLLVESAIDKEDNIGLGGRVGEKLALLQKAWIIFKDHPEEAGPPFSEADLEEDGGLYLHYNDLDDKGNKLPNGQIKLVDDADFLGIDCSTTISNWKKVRDTGPPDSGYQPTSDEIEKLAEEARARREAAADAGAATKKRVPEQPGALDKLAAQAAARTGSKPPSSGTKAPAPGPVARKK